MTPSDPMQDPSDDRPDGPEDAAFDDAEDEGPDGDDTETDEGVADGRLSGVRVLIVDDDPDVRESIEAAFAAEGALTRAVGDGNEAVRMCHDDPPDLMVLDMMLPKRSGFLVLESVRGREDCPVVIMVTANEGKRHQAYAESLGADEYLQKPVPLDTLLDVSVRLLAARG